MALSKVAAVSGLGIALFPCKCCVQNPPAHSPHYLFAAVMFAILLYFCVRFYVRARGKHHKLADYRAGIYALSAAAIVASIVVLAINGFLRRADACPAPPLPPDPSRLVFWGEAVALIAFGISWLTASRVLPGITTKAERFSPFRAKNPPDPVPAGH